MNVPIFGDDVTLTPQGKILDNIFKFTGDGLLKIGLPGDFFFQMPDKFALPSEQSINQDGQLDQYPAPDPRHVSADRIFEKMDLEPGGVKKIFITARRIRCCSKYLLPRAF